MHQWESTIIEKATWKKAAFFTALFAALYLLINNSSLGVAGLLQITGGASILDLEFGFAKEKAFQMLTALGAEGRAFYLTKIVPLDFPFPLAYALFFAEWIALLQKGIGPRAWHKFLLYLPVVTMLLDWTENAGVIAMLTAYPDLPVWAASLASIAGMLKMIFLVGSVAATILLLLLSLGKRVRGKGGESL